ASGVCTDGHCQVPTCTDQAQNGAETELDCGGEDCPSCADTLGCGQAADCASGVCSEGHCQVPTCIDQAQNGAETDVDCGGGSCPACADTLGCGEAADCASGVCTDGHCQVPTCTDQVQNGAETDLDCGGPSCPTCANGQSCAQASDCTSGVCSVQVCEPPLVITSVESLPANPNDTDSVTITVQVLGNTVGEVVSCALSGELTGSGSAPSSLGQVEMAIDLGTLTAGQYPYEVRCTRGTQSAELSGLVLIVSLLAGEGSDGNLTAPGSSRVVNTYAYVTDATVAAGATALHVNDASGFSVDDEVLVIQMSGSSGTGEYEFALIQSVEANVLTLQDALSKTYRSGVFNTTAAWATQVVRVPHFADVSIGASESIVAASWNGYVGGVVAFRAQQLVVAGAIDVGSRGYRRGAIGNHNSPANAADKYGEQGESTYGRGTRTYPAKSLGGGGGTHGGNYGQNSPGGGGGGGHGTAGVGGCCATWFVGQYGQAGGAYGSADLSTLFMGSAGGCANSNAGNGGGIVYVGARSIEVQGAGWIGANGGQGETASGAGAGGSIFLAAPTMTIGSSRVVAAGGPQSGRWCSSAVPGRCTGYGGAGGVGRIRLDSRTLVGTSHPAAYLVSLD
ncbi:MAG: hypothetical protein HY901_15420, partial [Deltaproteobacteria bacterium]|nr:hypothetical protein [Deltaproteobacteria bacterium]